jgi:hypothetical protein
MVQRIVGEPVLIVGGKNLVVRHLEKTETFLQIFHPFRVLREG